MADNETPNIPRVNLQIEGPLGGQRIEEVHIDSNRLSPNQAYQQGLTDALAMPYRPVDILLQASCYICFGAFFMSVFRIIPGDRAVIIPACVAIGSITMATIYAAWKHPALRRPIEYRMFLLLVGGVIGELT